MNKKVILMILDGWGQTQDPKVSAIEHANTPFIDSLYTKYPHNYVLTHGLNVGLPEGQMGNSEVGHMNLGAGRIVYQDLAKINIEVENKKIFEQIELKNAFSYALKNNKKVHFLGLVSDGGVHSHEKHLYALIDAAAQYGVEDIFIHAFTDGRDVDPKSGLKHIEQLEHKIKNKARIASVIGRYFAMDRDKRWERVAKAYHLLVHGKGIATTNIQQSITQSYDNNITDEFIEPIVVTDSKGIAIGNISKDDVVIFFNFRTDRGRELTQMLSQSNFKEYNTKALPLYYVTLTNYDPNFKNIFVVYNKENITKTLGEVLALNNKKQIRIAETEKYPHVTFFFSGGQEAPFENESRILCPSPKVATYDLKPEMSAFEIKDALLTEINKKEVDFVCLNFANGDMVGHTGDMEAAIKACEAVDKCVKELVEAGVDNEYSFIVLADHGNCETMLNEDGTPNTAHTTNPVPIILVDRDIKQINHGVLADIAPTILKLMGVKKPDEMTGNSLV